MTIMRIISRLILRKSPQDSPLRWFSTVAPAPAPAKPSKRDLLLTEVIGKSSSSSVVDILDTWVSEGNQVRKNNVFDLIRYFRKRNKFRPALQVYDWIDHSSNLKLTNADQAIRIDLLCKGEGVDSAEEYFNSLQESEKTVKTYGTLLSCYCRERVLDKALEIFDKMKVLKYTTTLNYNSVAALYYKMEQPEKAVSVVQEMEEKNITPDIYTYNLLINSYATLKDFGAVENIVEKMISSDIKPDSFTYGNVAGIYVESGLHEKANAYLELMDQMQFKDDREALEGHYTRLRLYSMMNDLSGVNRAWEAIKLASPTISNTSYLLMLLALLKLGNKENLVEMFKEWEEGCSVYDFRLPNVLLQYYLDHNMIEEANSLYESMGNREEEPNLKTLNLFAILCIKKGQIDLALNYLEKGLDKSKPGNNWFPTDVTVKLFVDYFEANNDTDRAEKFIQSMKKNDRLDSNSLLSNMKVPHVES